MTTFVKLFNSNKNTMLRLQWRNVLFTRTMTFTYECFIKILKQPSVWPPTAQTRTRLTTLYEGLCSRACIADFQPGRSQRQSGHLLGKSWQTDHRQIYCSLVWRTECCGSSEWWTYWTVDLTITFISCRALLCSVCVPRTCVNFAIIVYQALPGYCDKKQI